MANLQGKTILVADDELGFREVIGDELVLEGAEVIAVESGDQVMPFFEQQKIDAVISDVRMPRIDGLALLDLLKKRNVELPVFLLTGFADAQIEDIYHRGADGVFNKPCDMEVVIAEMARSFLPVAERYIQSTEPVLNPISVTVSSKQDLFGSAVNLGRNGLFIQSNGPHPRLNAEVPFSIRMTSDETEFKGVGVCRWTRMTESPGFGLQFLRLEPNANAIYLELIKRESVVASIPKGPGVLR